MTELEKKIELIKKIREQQEILETTEQGIRESIKNIIINNGKQPMQALGMYIELKEKSSRKTNFELLENMYKGVYDQVVEVKQGKETLYIRDINKMKNSKG